MINLININENGVAWVETDSGETFGIVNAFTILDDAGIEFFGKSALDILEPYDDGEQISQDWDNESNVISFKFDNGESLKLVIDAEGVELQ